MTLKQEDKSTVDHIALIRQHLNYLHRSSMTEDESAASEQLNLYLHWLFGPASRPRPTEDMFRALIPKVLLTRHGVGRNFVNQKTGKYGSSYSCWLALNHRNCPKDLIALGVRSGSDFYRDAALSNPRCPDESLVEAWLTDGTVVSSRGGRRTVTRP